MSLTKAAAQPKNRNRWKNLLKTTATILKELATTLNLWWRIQLYMLLLVA